MSSGGDRATAEITGPAIAPVHNSQAPHTVVRNTLAHRGGIAGLVLLLLVAIALAAGIGGVDIGPGQILAVLAAKLGIPLPWEYTPQQESVLLAVRLPRVLLAIIVGSGLAICGAAMQGLFRNPLADPALIGVSSGASLGVVSVIVLGATYAPWLHGHFGAFALPVAAFIGGAAATFLVYKIAARKGGVTIATMLLAGIAINALAWALTGLLTFLATDTQLRDITFWGLGSLGGATWESVGAIAPFAATALIGLPLMAGGLNAMLLGESEAGHLGIRVDTLKRIVVILTSLGVGAAVAMAGTIGFVGLVAPHLLRLALGPNHRTLLPGAALLGAILLLLADLVARTIVAPAELPIGIITAIIGAPFFLWLLIRDRNRNQWG